MASIILRSADRADLPGLVSLEAEVFAADRLSPRSFRRIIGAASAACRVAVADGVLAGYHVILFRRGSTAARLYSIAVAPGFRGRGLAGILMRDAEEVALERGSRRLRLEVRADNASAIRLYERLGYRAFKRVAGYYADGAHALRHERHLVEREKNLASSASEDRSPRDSRATLAYMHQTVRPDLAAAARAEATRGPVPSASPMIVPALERFRQYQAS
jgi:[ribosomal protein S18]-alanine N-acetyltransferase